MLHLILTIDTTKQAPKRILVHMHKFHRFDFLFISPLSSSEMTTNAQRTIVLKWNAHTHILQHDNNDNEQQQQQQLNRIIKY